MKTNTNLLKISLQLRRFNETFNKAFAKEMMRCHILRYLLRHYNRGYTLFRLYESLKNQGTTDFEWLIVNDGSTDNTHQLVEEWIRKEKEFFN